MDDRRISPNSMSAYESPDLKFTIARSRRLLEASFRLTYEAYLHNRLVTPNRLGLRILPHQLLRTSWVFVASRQGQVVATVTLVEDGQFGLPIEAAYPAQVARLRAHCRRLVELTCLAHVKEDRDKRVRAILGLLCHAFRFCAARPIEDAVICVNPRHASFYRRRFGFTTFGPVGFCPLVCNQPAVPMWLNVRSPAGADVARRFADQNIDGGAAASLPLPIPRDVAAHFESVLRDVSPSPAPRRMAASA